MLTREQAIAKIRKGFEGSGVDEAELDSIISATPDDVIEAVMNGAEAVPLYGSDIMDLIENLFGKLGPNGHLPGCDGDHESDTSPDVNGITLVNDPDSKHPLGQHGLANIANLIKSLITYVASEDLRGFKRFMRERESLHGDDSGFSDSVSASMLAYVGLSLTNNHAGCDNEQCARAHARAGVVPDGFRKPQARAADDENVIDPRMFRHF